MTTRGADKVKRALETNRTGVVFSIRDEGSRSVQGILDGSGVFLVPRNVHDLLIRRLKTVDWRVAVVLRGVVAFIFIFIFIFVFVTGMLLTIIVLRRIQEWKTGISP